MGKIVANDEKREVLEQQELDYEKEQYEEYLNVQPELKEFLQTPENDPYDTEDDFDLAYEAHEEEPLESKGENFQYVESSLPNDEQKKTIKEKLETTDLHNALEDEDIQKEIFDEFDFDDDIEEFEENLLLQDDDRIHAAANLDEFIADLWDPMPGEWVRIHSLVKTPKYNNVTAKIIGQHDGSEIEGEAKIKVTQMTNKTREFERKAKVRDPSIKGEKEFEKRENERYVVELEGGRKLSIRKKNLELSIDPEQAKREAFERAEKQRAEKVFESLATAGTKIEEVIKENINVIDDRVLEIIQNRIKTERMEEPVNEQGIQGLELLHQRLKRELDRVQSTPALRLLDDCLQLFDLKNSYNYKKNLELDKDMNLADTEVEIAQTRVRPLLRSAFFGTDVFDQTMGDDGDIFSVAQVIQTKSGQKMVQDIYEKRIDPVVFMKEVDKICETAQSECTKLETLLQQLDSEMAILKDKLSPAEISQVRDTRIRMENELEDRKRVLGCVALILNEANSMRDAAADAFATYE